MEGSVIDFIANLVEADKTRTAIKLVTTIIADFIHLGSIIITFAAEIDLINFEFIKSAIDSIDLGTVRISITTTIEYQSDESLTI